MCDPSKKNPCQCDLCQTKGGVLLSPDDDTPRLVYADRLDEFQSTAGDRTRRHGVGNTANSRT